jgi:hypothetical protein
MPSQALYNFMTACKTWAMKTRGVSYQVISGPRMDHQNNQSNDKLREFNG